jgi:predicted permease
MMRILRSLLARARGLFDHDRAHDELREEMEAHLEMETAEYVRRGMSPVEARRKALISAGGLVQAAEAVRDQRGMPWVETLGSDVRYAFRALRRAPAFTAVVVLTLALGIGANTAIFSVVRAVVLKPLPHHDGERLVYLRHSTATPGGEDMSFSVPEVRDLRQGAPSLAGIAEFSPWTLILQTREGGERLDVGLVTGNYFEVMGLTPVLGRATRPSDDGPGADPVVVLTHETWLGRFGGDSTIVGRQIRLDNRAVLVVGVLEPAPFYPARVEALLNMVNSDHHLDSFMLEGRTHRMTDAVGRLAPGVSVEQVRAEVGAVGARVQADHPEAYDPAAHHTFAVIPFSDVLGARAQLILWLLVGAAAFVLIISAANVANLTLMRGVRREHEVAVRAALGAGIGRLRRLLLVENMVLALAGAVCGVALATAGVGLLTSLVSRYSPRASEIRLDGVVLAFALALSALVALLLSFLASLPREHSLAARIIGGTRRTFGTQRGQRLQRGLVVVQVAVSVVLLVGAGLLTRTMMRLADVDSGLVTEQVLTMSVSLLTPTELMTNPSADGAAKERYVEMRAELAALPGVTAVGVGSPTLLSRSSVRFDVKAEARTLHAGEAMPQAELRTADAEFFLAAGIPLLEGRPFATTDGAESARVVIINQALAEHLFGGEDPVGRRIAWTGDVLRFTPITDEWRTVVGVIGNTRDGGLDAEPRHVVYMPFAQMLAIGGGFVIRADGDVDVASLTPAATRIIRRHAPTVPIENVRTVEQIREESIGPRRLNAVLIGSFGLLAMFVAAVGIAGVLAFSVSARHNEIGIRMSLGADSTHVQRMILGEGGVLLGIGLLIGAAAAFLTARVIRGLLYGVTPWDPTTYAVVAVVMAAIGIVACWLPALRAARIDPAITMRS